MKSPTFTSCSKQTIMITIEAKMLVVIMLVVGTESCIAFWKLDWFCNLFQSHLQNSCFEVRLLDSNTNSVQIGQPLGSYPRILLPKCD